MGKGDDLLMCSPHFPPLLFLALATQSLEAYVDNFLFPTVNYSFHSSHNHWSSSSMGSVKDIYKIGSDLYVFVICVVGLHPQNPSCLLAYAPK